MAESASKSNTYQEDKFESTDAKDIPVYRAEKEGLSTPVNEGMLKSFKIHVSKIFLSEKDEEEDMKLLNENAPAVVEKMKEVDAREKKPAQTPADEKYTLDHTIVVYLMGP